MNFENIKTLGDLKKSGIQPKSIKEELRSNLIKKLRNNEVVFPGIFGYEDSVIPDLERAILAKHSINLLGLRGQAKTRLARLMINLLDEKVPYIEGSDIHDDPFNPISNFGKNKLNEDGDKLKIAWLDRNERYVEKLATPDVSVADLIGDVDPIKAANLKIDYSDERVIHYGLIPRSNRCIFVINELPDLQARIQVALFNILQEGDVQIRGFQMRLPLDIQFVFTANPEDYTNRGSIITPLKDRIQSQIMTHYPKTRELAKEITSNESKIEKSQSELVKIPEILKDLIEQIAIEARDSEFVDEKSGVSARLSISALETLYSAAERRAILNNEKSTTARISDLMSVIPAIIGKIEMVYEGEQEGAVNVSYALIRSAIRSVSMQYFPELKDLKKRKSNQSDNYESIKTWFSSNSIDIMNNASNTQYGKSLSKVDGLNALIKSKFPSLPKEGHLLMMEFLLHAMAEYSYLSKSILSSSFEFRDLFSSMFNPENRLD